ncbi:hypothetical protein Clacol_007470 [Clathrus columnatus]|uniref:SH3 domain-containing protein n=1 Tax=Clathrus columnatus TaxID=1419009 RepID=A0AAV5AJA8_9AGAM|nr:hypothetical protein Clacol_007470 [Clathrus columnatus]
MFAEKRRYSRIDGSSHPNQSRKLVQAKYNWDGETMSPAAKGLSLKQGALFEVLEGHPAQPGWLYGFRVNQSGPFWRFFSLFSKRGYFPESFVSVDQDEKGTDEHLEITDVDTTQNNETPPLPSFKFPLAAGWDFDKSIGDNGHAFLRLAAAYDCISLPTDPTRVIFSLNCITGIARLVSSISICITIPGSIVQKVEICENEVLLRQIRSTNYYDRISNAATAGFQPGMSIQCPAGYTEGKKVSVDVGIQDIDTIYWNFKTNDNENLDGTGLITLTLTKKPAKFKYKCRLTQRNLKIKQRYTFGN